MVLTLILVTQMPVLVKLMSGQKHIRWIRVDRKLRPNFPGELSSIGALRALWPLSREPVALVPQGCSDAVARVKSIDSTCLDLD